MMGLTWIWPAGLLLAALVAAAVVAVWVRRMRREIAERKRAEARLEAAQRQLRDVTDNAPAFIFQVRFDDDFRRRYLFASRGVERLSGHTVQETLADPDLLTRTLDAPGQALVRANWEQSLRSGAPYSAEYRARHRDGGQRWLRTSAVSTAASDGGVVWNGFTVDITDRKEAEARLEAAEKLLRQVTDNAPGFFFQLAFDEAGNRRYHFVSRGVERLTGYAAEEILAQPNLIFEITEDGDRPAVAAAWQESRVTLCDYRVEYRVRTRGGGLRWLRGSAVPSRSDEGAVVWNGFTIDISAEKETEARLQRAEQRTRQLTESLPGAVFSWSWTAAPSCATPTSPTAPARCSACRANASYPIPSRYRAGCLRKT